MAVELIGGFMANSLAIISDAVHLLSGIKFSLILRHKIIFKMWPDFLQVFWPFIFREDLPLQFIVSGSNERKHWAL